MVDDCWLERSRNVNCLLFVWMATIRRERSSTICLTRSRCVCSTFFFSLLLLFPVSFRLPFRMLWNTLHVSIYSYISYISEVLLDLSVGLDWLFHGHGVQKQQLHSFLGRPLLSVWPRLFSPYSIAYFSFLQLSASRWCRLTSTTPRHLWLH